MKEVDTLSKYYSDEQLNQVINVKPKNRITIGYCRVSSHKQKDDLERQIDNVKTYLLAKGQPFEIISDIGSGINYKKKGLRFKNLNPIPVILFVHSVFLIEFINTATSLSCFLLSCVEWMTFRTDFYMDFFACRSCHECITTVTSYSCLIIIWMYSFFHDFHLFFIFLTRT